MNNEDSVDDPARKLIELVRQGHSFSGRERNCLFLNTQGPQFADVSAASGFDFPDDARAAARVDWDNDGKLDLWISNRNAPQVRFLRNQVANSHRWISLRLQGTRSNRDAIGAKVRLTIPGNNDQLLVRTLRAGDGYLTQSSKSMHIGVGDASSCDVQIDWPSGQRTTYSQLATNERYLVIEGNSAAKRIEGARTVALKQRRLELPKPTDRLALFSMVRPALPRLEYVAPDQSVHDLIELRGQPILVTLWASWCQPCLLELAEIENKQKMLRESGLQVVTLSVDRLATEPGRQSESPAVRKPSDSFPFRIGAVTEPLMQKLQLVNDLLFGWNEPFPVPTSFLIDKDYRLAAIYRGRLDLQRLQQDVQHLELDPAGRRDRSVPFSGRWAAEPTTLPMAIEVLELIDAGFADDASELVQRIQSMFDKDTILQLVVRLGMAHQRAGSFDVANRHFEMARKIQPSTVGPEIELGRWYQSQGEFQKSIDRYRAALKTDPRSLPALNNLAWLLATCSDRSLRNGDQAVKLATTAVQLSGGRHPGLLDTLATSLAEVGRIEEAHRIAAQAIKLARDASRFHLAREIESRKASFE